MGLGVCCTKAQPGNHVEEDLIETTPSTSSRPRGVAWWKFRLKKNPEDMQFKTSKLRNDEGCLALPTLNDGVFIFYRFSSVAFFKARQRRSREGTVIEVSLPTVNVYNVEFAELPNECYGGGLAKPAPLPASIPMDKIMSNIAPWWQKLSPTSPSRTSIRYPCFSEICLEGS